MNIRPSAGNLLVLPVPDHEKSKGGIILDVKTTKSINPNIWGIVQSVGAGTPKRTMSMFRRNKSQGMQSVLIPRGAGTTIEQDGVKYKIISVDDVIGYVDNTEPNERNT